MDVVAILSHPTEQFALSEVFDVFSNYYSIHCGAPLFAGFQVNQPKCWVVFVQYHSLLRTDHINRNIPNIYTFHFLPQQYLSVAVWVEKKHFALLIIWVALLSLLLHQKYESIVEGSENIVNLCALLFEADGNRFFLKHRIQSINIMMHKYGRPNL